MNLRTHASTFISPLCDIEISTKGSQIIIGKNSYIDSFVKFKAAGGLGNIEIGENVTINSGCVLYIGNGIKIGDNSMIAANVTIAPVNHAFKNRDLLIAEQGFSESKGGVIIGNDVWVGAGCTLLDGTNIGDGAVIGAMSLVNSKIEKYHYGFGNPFKVVGSRSSFN